MKLENVAEFGGCVTGLLGSFLLAQHNTISGWGFVAYLGSNFFWLIFGFLAKRQWMILMQLGFTVTSVLGISRWLHVGIL